MNTHFKYSDGVWDKRKTTPIERFLPECLYQKTYMIDGTIEELRAQVREMSEVLGRLTLVLVQQYRLQAEDLYYIGQGYAPCSDDQAKLMSVE